MYSKLAKKHFTKLEHILANTWLIVLIVGMIIMITLILRFNEQTPTSIQVGKLYFYHTTDQTALSISSAKDSLLLNNSSANNIEVIHAIVGHIKAV